MKGVRVSFMIFRKGGKLAFLNFFSLCGLSVIGGLDYWNGLLEWTLTFFFFFFPPTANYIH